MKVISGKGNREYDCPELEKLMTFVLGIQKNSWIDKHLKHCELCGELAGGIKSFKKECLTVAEIRQQLNNDDEAFLKALKLCENPDDLVSEIAQKLELPNTLEKRIREVLESSEDELFSDTGKKGENEKETE